MVVFVLIALVSWTLNTFKSIYWPFAGLLLRNLAVVPFAHFYICFLLLFFAYFEFFMYSGY